MNAQDFKKVLIDFTTDNNLVKTILDRGLLICFKPTYEGKRFLLTGINPSFRDGHDVWPGEVGMCDISRSDDGYWKKKSKQFGNIWSQILYLDLFPVREKHQREFFEKTFKEFNVFRKNLLEITQTEIESLQPKLIVHANKDSMYYWGIKKNTPIGVDANDETNPWMGYKVKRVVPDDYDIPEFMRHDNRLELFPFYEIVGFVDSGNRINRFKYEKTALKGSFIMEYVMDGRNKKYAGKMFSPEEWQEIWNWVKKHTPSREP